MQNAVALRTPLRFFLSRSLAASEIPTKKKKSVPFVSVRECKLRYPTPEENDTYKGKKQPVHTHAPPAPVALDAHTLEFTPSPPPCGDSLGTSQDPFTIKEH